MAIIIGSETGGGAGKAYGKEKGYVTKRTATASESVATLKLKVLATSTTTKWRLAIFKSVAGKPSTIMAETATITVAAETELVVSGSITPQALTSGEEYFLGLLALDGTGKVKGTNKAAWGYISTLGITELDKGIYSTETEIAGEPLPIWGETSDALLAKPTVRCTLQDMAAALQSLGVKCTAVFKLSDSARALQAMAAKPGVRLILNNKVEALQTTAAIAASRFGYSNKAVAAQLLKASPTSRVVMGTNVTAAQAMRIAASNRLAYQAKVNVVFTEEGGTVIKRVAIFIFED